ncbi:MAG: hypothetical protein R3330_04770 [Saprospiraceae bacterium]|nr:hypothetical protein [Saprospiraceae bacterium]
MGTLYIDTSGGVPYMKQTGTGNTGWAVLHSTSTYVRVGTGTPEGSVTATIGTIYLDTTNGALYMKESGAGNTGWVPISTRATEENSAHTIGPTDRIVNVDTSGGSVVITLPDNAGDSGHAFIVRRDGGSTVTINRAGSDTFDDGHTQKTLDSDGAAIGLFSIGDTEWKIVATEGTVGGS